MIKSCRCLCGALDSHVSLHSGNRLAHHCVYKVQMSVCINRISYSVYRAKHAYVAYTQEPASNMACRGQSPMNKKKVCLASLPAPVYQTLEHTTRKQHQWPGKQQHGRGAWEQGRCACVRGAARVRQCLTYSSDLQRFCRVCWRI